MYNLRSSVSYHVSDFLQATEVRTRPSGKRYLSKHGKSNVGVDKVTTLGEATILVFEDIFYSSTCIVGSSMYG